MVCIMEWMLHNKQYSKEVKMSVVIVVIGVGVCTVTDVKVNAKGFLCACVAVLSTSLQQIVSKLLSVSFSPTGYVGVTVCYLNMYLWLIGMKNLLSLFSLSIFSSREQDNKSWYFPGLVICNC